MGILSQLRQHRDEAPDRPFVIGLNGIQGAGKSTLVKALCLALEEENVPTLVCSIDEFYLTRADQVALAESHPDNALVQHRGEPGTHDPLLQKPSSMLFSRENLPSCPSTTRPSLVAKVTAFQSQNGPPSINQVNPRFRQSSLRAGVSVSALSLVRES